MVTAEDRKTPEDGETLYCTSIEEGPSGLLTFEWLSCYLALAKVQSWDAGEHLE